MIRLYIASLAGGGSERVATDLGNGFVDKGLDVEVLLVNASGPYLDRLDHRARVVDFKASRGLKALTRVSKHIRGAPHTPVLVFGFNLGVAVLLARRMGWHKAPVIYREGSSPKWNIKPSQQWGYRWAISRADKVIAQSKAAREELSQLGVPVEKVFVIPNPRRPPAYLAAGSQREPTRESPLILGVGRLSPEKRFDRLIHGFKRLQASIPSVQLCILGEGQERGQLEQLIDELGLKQSVSLPGFVSDPGPWYQRASIFALSSRYEGQPNALIEAILHECPVVCAAGGGGTVELMQAAGLDDCVVPDEQFEQQFAECARRVMGIEGSRWKIARERITKLTDFETVLRQYLSVCGVNVPSSSSAGRS